MRLVRNFGINDADYKVTEWSGSKGKQKLEWICPFYQAWSGMIARCYSATSLSAWPTYIGCSVSQEWKSFSKFREWMITQDWKGNELDKDLLNPGNKIYCQNNCLFVSKRVNSFLIDSAASRGEWPIGVSWNARNGNFYARCRNPFIEKQELLGAFNCPEQAHAAWKARKLEHAIKLASQQKDERIARALAARYA